MAKQTFKTPLNFQEVEVGTREDKVLVRTADGDVKEVSSDSFGGGGSQNLQQTIENGGLYLVDDSDKTRAVAFFEPTLDEGTVLIQSVDKTPENKGQLISLNQTATVIGGRSEGNEGQFVIRRNNPSIIKNNGTSNALLDLSLEDPTITGLTKIVVPAKTPRFEEDGVTPIPYKLATLDDISVSGTPPTLDEVLGSGNSATNKTIVINDTFYSRNADIRAGAATFISGSYSGTLSSGGVVMNSGDSESSQLSYGYLGFRQDNVYGNYSYDSLYFNNRDLNENVIIKPNSGVAGDRTFTFPSKSSGTYTLATLDDITGGGSQDLQSVVDNGKVVSVDSNNSYIVLLEGAENGRTVLFNVNNGSGKESTFFQDSFSIKISSEYEESQYSSEIGINYGKFNALQSRYIDEDGIPVRKATSLEFQNPIGESGNGTTILVPAKETKYESDGSTQIPYVLATTDDISSFVPTINNVLSEDPVAIDKYIELNSSNGNNSTYLGNDEISLLSNSYHSNLSPTALILGNESAIVNLEINRERIRQTSDRNNNETRLYFERTESGTAMFTTPPTKPAGSYILATSDEITIQNALSVNNRTDQGIKVQQEAPDTDAYVSYVSYTSEGINGRTETGHAYYYSSDGMRISAEGGGELTYTSGNRSLEWNADTENPRKTRLSLDRTTDGESVFSFPERDGNFTLVTASDIAVSNNTTTVLSASDLNTAYPIAIVGTQVHCLSITTGAVIYTKTAVGWVQHSITAVS